MKRLRFSEEQIIGVLKEAEAGAKTGELARRHGVSEATIYNWKAKYGGLEVSEAKRLRSLEDENAKLKRLLADSLAQPNAAARAIRLGMSSWAVAVAAASPTARAVPPSTCSPSVWSHCTMLNQRVSMACRY